MSKVCRQIFYYVFILSGALCLRVHVRVSDDDSHYEEYDQDYRLYNSVDSYVPPFQLPEMTTDEKVTHRHRYLNELIREKRDFTFDIREFERFPFEECRKKIDDMLDYMSHQKRPIHLSLVVNINDTIAIPCYYCGDPAVKRPPVVPRKMYRWRVSSRNKAPDGRWTLGPVIGGYKDNDTDFQSRVEVTKNDTLILRNIQEKDTGLYYCAEQKEKQEYWYYTDRDARHIFSNLNPYYFHLFFHIDVSTTDSSLPQPAGNVKDAPANLEYFTRWQDWSTCSVCGQEGERKRYGPCHARMINWKIYIRPAFVYATLLGAGGVGLPCRASLFKFYPKMKARDRPDEMMTEICNVPCANATNLKNMTIDLNRLKFNSLANGLHTNVKVMEGDSIALKCPRASPDAAVYWVNGSKYITSLQLRNITNRRAEIDVYGLLRFHRTIMADTGLYSCWHTKKLQMIYELTVIPHTRDDWVYHLQFVGLSFIFDTFVFIALLAVRHKHRHVHQRRQPQSDDSDDGDVSEEFNDNRDESFNDGFNDDEEIYLNKGY
ncbi:uncharacterized protein [Argopecten irradians]|uniref:uncharacterized protein isoform X2 n=1 Tax=Argopecten irradians TaxID=31199 RepID=UPI003716976F